MNTKGLPERSPLGLESGGALVMKTVGAFVLFSVTCMSFHRQNSMLKCHAKL